MCTHHSRPENNVRACRERNGYEERSVLDGAKRGLSARQSLLRYLLAGQMTEVQRRGSSPGERNALQYQEQCGSSERSHSYTLRLADGQMVIYCWKSAPHHEQGTRYTVPVRSVMLFIRTERRCCFA